MYILDFDALVDGILVTVLVTNERTRHWFAFAPEVESKRLVRERALREARHALETAGATAGEAWQVKLAATTECERIAALAEVLSA